MTLTPLIQRHPCSQHPDSTPIKDGRCAECLRLYRRARYRTHGITPQQRYENAKASARLRGLAFTLTYSEWLNIISQPCIYRLKDQRDIHVGIDRRDSRQGYTIENSVPCCEKHNRLKSDILTYQQTAETVARFRIPCGNTQRGRPRVTAGI